MEFDIVYKEHEAVLLDPLDWIASGLKREDGLPLWEVFKRRRN